MTEQRITVGEKHIVQIKENKALVSTVTSIKRWDRLLPVTARYYKGTRSSIKINSNNHTTCRNNTGKLLAKFRDHCLKSGYPCIHIRHGTVENTRQNAFSVWKDVVPLLTSIHQCWQEVCHHSRLTSFTMFTVLHDSCKIKSHWYDRLVTLSLGMLLWSIYTILTYVVFPIIIIESSYVSILNLLLCMYIKVLPQTMSVTFIKPSVMKIPLAGRNCDVDILFGHDGKFVFNSQCSNILWNFRQGQYMPITICQVIWTGAVLRALVGRF